MRRHKAITGNAKLETSPTCISEKRWNGAFVLECPIRSSRIVEFRERSWCDEFARYFLGLNLKYEKVSWIELGAKWGGSECEKGNVRDLGVEGFDLGLWFGNKGTNQLEDLLLYYWRI